MQIVSIHTTNKTKKAPSQEPVRTWLDALIVTLHPNLIVSYTLSSIGTVQCSIQLFKSLPAFDYKKYNQKIIDCKTKYTSIQ